MVYDEAGEGVARPQETLRDLGWKVGVLLSTVGSHWRI